MTHVENNNYGISPCHEKPLIAVKTLDWMKYMNEIYELLVLNRVCPKQYRPRKWDIEIAKGNEIWTPLFSWTENLIYIWFIFAIVEMNTEKCVHIHIRSHWYVKNPRNRTAAWFHNVVIYERPRVLMKFIPMSKYGYILKWDTNLQVPNRLFVLQG